MPNLKGIITSARMNGTVVVAIPYTVRHRKYGKVMKKTIRLSAHSDIPGLAVGDTVGLEETKPYGKTVCFKVVDKKS